MFILKKLFAGNSKYKAGILAVVKGKWIIFKGELAEGPQPQPRAGVYLGNSLH
jgi:hypothetical protein